MAYPGYGGAPGYPVGPDPLYGYFAAVAGQDQQIDAHELQRCLSSSGVSGNYQHLYVVAKLQGALLFIGCDIPQFGKAHALAEVSQFSLDTCRIMIAMLNRDQDARMGFNEFKELWAVLNQWKTSFMQYDRDRSGTVEPHELQAALTSWGYNLSPTAIQIIVNRYSTNHRIGFDDFVACAVRLRSLTDHFRRRDTAQQGMATFRYDDFIQVCMFS